MSAVVKTELAGVELVARGKVRDIYALDGTLLLVCTDRISAFDVVLPQPIPAKGKVLHQISSFWLAWSRSIVDNHLIADRFEQFPERLEPFKDQLEGRTAWVRRADMYSVECVARGYLAGSGWKEYQASGSVCGIKLPEGLVESERLPEPIFTPATKAQTGHDVNISFDEMVGIIGGEAAEKLRELTLTLYTRASEFAEKRGILIADTKFDFGLVDGQLALCDEALTPDSSRFWPEDEYAPGRSQPSFDKQYLRDFLDTLGWDK
ncbi:MAG: phosphoribosylaminoimidazolesuccinocarboxamide synthase, partial [Acidobacteriota bacterium]